MVSDQEFATLTQQVRPLAAELRVKLIDMEAGKPLKKLVPVIHSLIDQLEVYTSEREWLEQYLIQVREAVAPYAESYQRYRRNLNIHIGILAFLALVPVGCYVAGLPPMIIGLLVLPVIGWYVIGIRAYTRRFRHMMG